jgi:RNA methyltransferase, TrmH family
MRLKWGRLIQIAAEAIRSLIMKFISSRDNPFFKKMIKLAGSAQQRRAAGLTLLDGVHLVSAYRVALGQPEVLIMSESGGESAEIKRLLEEWKPRESLNLVVLSDSLFREVSPVKTPTGIMALARIPSAETILIRKPARNQNKRGGNEGFCVLLEAIQDAGNVGSILRSAAAAGATDIYLSNDCTDAWSPKTLRAAMGAHFFLHIHEQSNLPEVVRAFSGKVIATSLRAKNSLYQTELTGPIALVFGNEGVGLSDAVLQVITDEISIPMPGGTESLNVAAAAAVCFFERVRQMETA